MLLLTSWKFGPPKIVSRKEIDGLNKAFRANFTEQQRKNLGLDLQVQDLKIQNEKLKTDNQILETERMETLNEKAQTININTVLTNQLEKMGLLQCQECPELQGQLKDAKIKQEKIEKLVKQMQNVCVEKDQNALELKRTHQAQLEQAEQSVQAKLDKLAGAGRVVRRYRAVMLRTQERASKKVKKERRFALKTVSAFQDKEKTDQGTIENLEREVADHKRDPRPWDDVITRQTKKLTLFAEEVNRLRTANAKTAVVDGHICDHSKCVQDAKEKDDEHKLLAKNLRQKNRDTESASAEKTAALQDHIRDHSKCLEEADDKDTQHRFLVDNIKQQRDRAQATLDEKVEADKAAAEKLGRDMEEELDWLDSEGSRNEPAVEAKRSDDEGESGVGFIKAEHVPLPEAVDADIEGQHASLVERDADIKLLRDTLKDTKAHLDRLKTENGYLTRSLETRDSQVAEKDRNIQNLGGQLEEEKQSSQRVEAQLKEIESTNSDCGTRANKSNELNRGLDQKLKAEVQASEQLKNRFDKQEVVLQQLTTDLSCASAQFSELKQSLGVSSELGIIELGSTLNDWMSNIRSLNHLGNHVCGHSQCNSERKQLQHHIDEISPKLIEITAQYGEKDVSLQRKTKDFDWLVKKHNASMAKMAKMGEEKNTEMEKLLKDHAEAIRKARDEGAKIAQANDPQRRSLRDLLLDTKQKFDNVTSELATRTQQLTQRMQELAQITQELAKRTEERDYEQNLAQKYKAHSENYAEDCNKYLQQVQQLKADQRRLQEEIEQLKQQGLKADQSREQLIEGMLKLGGENNALLKEVAQHTVNAGPSGVKRGANVREDKEPGDEKAGSYDPNKKAKADV